MKFLKRRRKAKRVILSISDLHLGAGEEIKGRKNSLEDFHSDEELVQFFEYYSSGEYQNKEEEIVISSACWPFHMWLILTMSIGVKRPVLRSWS